MAMDTHVRELRRYYLKSHKNEIMQMMGGTKKVKQRKKKILFVMNNMCMGGIQKALICLLNELCTKYDITLLLFWKHGSLINEIPTSVRVIETRSMFRFLGMSQQDCVTAFEKMIRGAFVVLTRIFGRNVVIRLMKPSVYKDKLGWYDAVISYSHCQARNVFYAGTAEYVLQFGSAKKRICYIHCDYEHSGTECCENNDIYRAYDQIVCVSESVKTGFLRVLPDMEEKTVAIENPINKTAIMLLSNENQYKYEKNTINILSVARMCQEKGIERVIRAFGNIQLRNYKYYIVGDGDKRCACEELVKTLGLANNVFFMHEDLNPYRYMKNADMLVVPSYHEAAPVVFQEAIVLGLPVLTTRTLSADEMIGERNGWVVDNKDSAIEDKMVELLSNKREIRKKRQEMQGLGEKKRSAIEFYEAIL